MRILTVGNQYPPHHSGGYELVWQAAVAHLRELGHEVRVLTTDHRTAAPESAESDVHRELRWYWREHSIRARALPGCLAIERHNLRTLRRHLRSFEPDVLSWWSMGAMSMSLIEAGRRTGLPAVAFVHDDWLDYGRRTDGWYRRFRRRPRLGRIAERLTGVPTHVDFASAARYMFVSERTRARSLMGGLALHETGIAHSGIETAFLLRAPARDWDWSLLYVGRLDSRKGIDTAIEALALLPGEATLTIVGEGDPGELERLQRSAVELGIEGRARFLGPRGRAELPGLYRAADAVLFPVRWEEPWGLVPLEAMAVGRPVAATGRGGSGEYLRDEENCLLFPVGDAAALAASLRRLAGDAELRERLRDAGFQTAAAHTDARFHRDVAAALLGARGGAVATPPSRRRPEPDAPAKPPITVVIPTLGRNDRLRRALAALDSQDLPGHIFEVIVVADAAADAAAVDAVVAAPSRPYPARTLAARNPGAAAARNAGWRAARSELILFLGDDILADRALLSQHLAWHERHPDERVGVLGNVRWARELTVTPFMRWLEHGLQFNFPSIDGIDAGLGHFYTANVSLKRAMLERVDGFDEERFPFLYEDIDLGYRLYRIGFQLLYNRRADAQHLHPSAPEDWGGRMAATARAERMWVRRHPEFEPYFHDRLSFAASVAPLRGRATRLLPWTPRRLPWLGRRVWENSTIYFHQQLAPAFLKAWNDEERAAHQSRSVTAGASASTPSTLPTTRAGDPTAIE